MIFATGGGHWTNLVLAGALERDGQIEDRRIMSWTLAGDARIVARGELTEGSAELPETPALLQIL